jgi:hypothetical protein
VTIGNLPVLFREWKEWCVTADRSEDGWESDFPQWQALIETACHAMTQGAAPPETVAILAECWSASQEDEELLTFAGGNLDKCWPTIQVLVQSNLPGCRWQVYEVAAGIGRQAEGMLRQGLSDQDAYARRRALLSLSRLRPSDAHVLAERFGQDPDPYMRQAAIEMIMASGDQGFQQDALTVLRADSVEHVRKAAEAGLRKLGSET